MRSRDSHHAAGSVDVTTVAEVVSRLGLTHVDFLKIDVEGFDFSVLKGVPWNSLQPDVIEAEFEDGKTVPLGHTYHDVCDFLVEKGYTVYLSEWHPIVRYGIPHDWRQVVKYPTKIACENAWGNIVAFRVDPGLDAVQQAFRKRLKVDGRSDYGGAIKGAMPGGDAGDFIHGVRKSVQAVASIGRKLATKGNFGRVGRKVPRQLPGVEVKSAVMGLLTFVDWLIGAAERNRRLGVYIAAVLAVLFIVAILINQPYFWLAQLGLIAIAAAFGIAVAYSRYTSAQLREELKRQARAD